MKYPSSKNIILGVLFVFFLFFILYSLMNSNPLEGMSSKKQTPSPKAKGSPTPPKK